VISIFWWFTINKDNILQNFSKKLILQIIHDKILVNLIVVSKAIYHFNNVLIIFNLNFQVLIFYEIITYLSKIHIFIFIIYRLKYIIIQHFLVLLS